MRIIMSLLMLVSFAIPWFYKKIVYEYWGYTAYEVSVKVYGFGRISSSAFGITFSAWAWSREGFGSSVYYLGPVILILTLIYFVLQLRPLMPALQTPEVEKSSPFIGILALVLGLIYGIKAFDDFKDNVGVSPAPIGFIIFLVFGIITLILEFMEWQRPASAETVW